MSGNLNLEKSRFEEIAIWINSMLKKPTFGETSIWRNIRLKPSLLEEISIQRNIDLRNPHVEDPSAFRGFDLKRYESEEVSMFQKCRLPWFSMFRNFSVQRYRFLGESTSKNVHVGVEWVRHDSRPDMRALSRNVYVRMYQLSGS